MAKYINADNLIKGLKEQHGEIVKKIASAKTVEEKEKLKINSENVAGLIFLINYLDGESVIPAEEVEKLYFERDLALMQLKNDYGVGVGERKNPNCITVVRCKDCIYSENEGQDILFCSNFSKDMMPDDYCSVGEREEQNED